MQPYENVDFFLHGQKYFYWCLSRNLTFMSTEIYHISIAYTYYFQKIMVMFLFLKRREKNKGF